MSYYDNGPSGNPAWPAARPPWDSRVGASAQLPGGNGGTRALTQFAASPMKPEDPLAFSSQLDEVDRAVDNLVKSGKMYPQQRRDSMPLMAPRGFNPQQEHVPGIPPQPRHYPQAVQQDFEAARPHSASTLQTFYANQRFQPQSRPGPSETDQVLQAKRRIAAQRERELRNYHQEQQYNRSGVTMLGSDINNYGKDRVISPSGLSEEDNRQNHAPRPIGSIPNGNNGPSTANSTRGPSPMSFDPFGIQNGNNNGGNDSQLMGNNQQENHGQMGGSNTTSNSPERSRTNSASNPESAFDWQVTSVAGVQPQSSRTSASSPTGGHDLSRVSTTPVTPAGVVPIGTRPSGQLQSHNQSAPNLQKRSTTPLPSPLSYGFTANNGNNTNGSNDAIGSLPKERSGSAASNQSNSQQANGNESSMGGWKVWGNNNKSLNTVASVWG